MTTDDADEPDLTRVEPGCAGADGQDLPQSENAAASTDAKRPDTTEEDVPLPFDESPF